MAQGLPFAHLRDYSRKYNLPLDPVHSQQAIQASRTLQVSGSAQGPPLVQPLRASQVLNPATGPSQGLTLVEHFNILVYKPAVSMSQAQPSGISQMSNPAQLFFLL